MRAIILVLGALFSFTAFANLDCTLEDGSRISLDAVNESVSFASKNVDAQLVELEVKQFLRARCPGCFTVEASLNDTNFEFTTRGGMFGKKGSIQLTIKSEQGDEQELSGTCE